MRINAEPVQVLGVRRVSVVKLSEKGVECLSDLLRLVSCQCIVLAVSFRRPLPVWVDIRPAPSEHIQLGRPAAFGGCAVLVVALLGLSFRFGLAFTAPQK